VLVVLEADDDVVDGDGDGDELSLDALDALDDSVDVVSLDDEEPAPEPDDDFDEPRLSVL
jgi:hypothetical protein